MEKLLKGKKVAVLGLGMEGKELVRYLQSRGAKITAFDQREEKDLDFSGINKYKIQLICGRDYLSEGLLGYDSVYRSAGVYRYTPELTEADRRGIEISSEMKLFFDLCPSRIIGITGTKGKGTTATLIYQILKKSGYDVHLAGNIGITRLQLLPKLRKTSWVVLELSSFQLIDLTKSPHIAVVLNITTDHLDWHKDRREYVEAKANIVRYQRNIDFAVLNWDYEDSRSFAKLTKAKAYYFSKDRKVSGCYVQNEKIVLNTKGKKEEIGNISSLKLRGKHNWENVCAAVCAAHLAGASSSSIKKTALSFRGLEHRLELVGKIRDISFYNDSFSTNSQTTVAAIKSFNEPITLILGGSDKGLNYDKMAGVISKRENIKTIILIGQIGSIIRKALIERGFKGNLISLGKASMKKIVKVAFAETDEGGVVLLSPATASFDMFEDYKDRGKQFINVVKLLRD
jgi:UDP-N-acetylmuramoylalanine--D-glutamate ligase